MIDRIKNDVNEVKDMMQELMEDRSVPKNIRNAVKEAFDKINVEKPDSVAISAAIYSLDDISNDINMPSHTRTAIWEIISRVESIKENIK